MSKLFTAVTLSFLGVTFLGMDAYAGRTTTSEVYVSGNGYASGAFRSARESADGEQYIYCSSEAWNDNYERGFCYARDANGNSEVCYINNGSTNLSSMTRILESLGQHSRIMFRTNSNGECTSINVYNGSHY